MADNQFQKKFIKQYIIKSIAVSTFVTGLATALIVVSVFRDIPYVVIPCSCIAVILYFVCLYEIKETARRMIFVDQFTFIGNAAHVVRKATVLHKKGKLKDYNGILINLKNLKYVNQRYGVDNGDNIIRLFANLLAKSAKNMKGYAGRIGGDNYYVLIPKTCQEQFLKDMMEVYFPVHLDDEIVKIPIRGRFAINELSDETNPRLLILHGLITVTVCRNTHEDVSVYSQEIMEHFENEKKILTEAKYGMKHHEFIPYYQPKVDLKTGLLCGCEALARWDKKGTMISPAQFIPPMEKEGLITDLDFIIFESVCMDIRNWISLGITPVRVSSNFSKLHLRNPDFIKKIIEIKNKYDIDGEYLEIELTESAGINDFGFIQRVVDEIREAGMHVSIDDFGTGYSSLSMLQTVNVDVVKMDKSFLDNSFKEDSRQFIVDVINIVKHQKEKVLFEGVESEEQVQFLMDNNCDIIQGYYYDKPLAHSEFEKRLINPQYK